MTRTKLTQAQAQQQALDAYIENMEVADQALTTITDHMENRGNVSPEQVTWADVGNMARIANQLKELADMINGTGEFAE